MSGARPFGGRGLATPLGAVVALIGASAVFGWPLLANKALPMGSDVSYHAQWAQGFVEALGDGSLYPRWISETNRGFGAPIFVFYPPLSYYAVAAAWLATGEILSALRVTLAAAAFLAGLSFWLAARRMASEPGATVGAVLYILLPYHVLDLYERFALAEFCAFVWFPLLFLAVWRLARRPCWRSWFLLTAGFAGLALTHLMSAYLVLFVLGPYALVQTQRAGAPKRLLPMAAAGLVALLCCAVYLVPFLAQRELVHLDWFDGPHYDWRRNFTFRDEEAFGFRPDSIKPWVNAAAVTQALVALAAWAVLSLRFGPAALEARDAETWRDGRTHVALSFWALFLQTPLSSMLWANVPQLGAAQFPWRFSALQMLAGCFVCAYALSSKKAAPLDTGVAPEAEPEELPWEVRWLSVTLRRRPALAVGLLVVAATPALVVSARLTQVHPYTFDEELARSPAYRTRVVQEFFPRGVQDWLGFSKLPYDDEKKAMLTGPGQVDVLAWQAHLRRLRVETPEPNQLRLQSFAYPGWQATLDGQPAPILEGDPRQIVILDVAAGRHEIELRHEPTWDMKLGAALSACGLVLLLGLGGIAARRRRS